MNLFIPKLHSWHFSIKHEYNDVMTARVLTLAEVSNVSLANPICRQ
jgi:hypothetical protein